MRANSASADAHGRYYATTKPVYNLNIGDGKCYVAENPILGADAALDASQRPIDQSFALPLAAALIEGGLFTHVLLVPISVSGTLIEQWTPSPPRTPGAPHFKRFVAAIEHLKHAGLAPTFVLWHQGEGNSGPLVSPKHAPRPDARHPAGGDPVLDAQLPAYRGRLARHGRRGAGVRGEGDRVRRLGAGRGDQESAGERRRSGLENLRGAGYRRDRPGAAA